MILLLITIKCSSLPRIATTMILVVIVLRASKELGGTKAVIIPTLMACTWMRVRIVAVESDGICGIIIQ